MSHKKTLLIITILLAVVSIQFWSSHPAANKAIADPLQQDFPTVAFDRATINITEPDSGTYKIETIQVKISAAPESGKAAKVTYRNANGNAVAGEDYLPLSGDLTFPVGSTDSQVFEVAIIGNNIHQSDRAFVVFLTNPVNATVGIPGAITIYILDNDVVARNYLPLIRGHVAGPPTPTPCHGYC